MLLTTYQLLKSVPTEGYRVENCVLATMLWNMSLARGCYPPGITRVMYLKSREKCHRVKDDCMLTMNA